MKVEAALEQALTMCEERMALAMDKYADLMEACEDPDKMMRINQMISKIINLFDEMTLEIVQCGESLKHWDTPNAE